MSLESKTGEAGDKCCDCGSDLKGEPSWEFSRTCLTYCDECYTLLVEEILEQQGLN